jgi:hypothetical protein
MAVNSEAYIGSIQIGRRDQDVGSAAVETIVRASAWLSGAVLGCVVGCGHIGYDVPEIERFASEAGGLGSAPDVGTPPEVESGAASEDVGPSSVAEVGVPEADSSVGACSDQAPIRLYEWNVALASTTNSLNFAVKLENHTNAAIPLASLTARYYFTNELASPWTAEVYYSDICCSAPVGRMDGNVLPSYHPMVSPAPNADSYLEFGFAAGAGNLAVGDAVQVELGFHAPAYDRNLSQANDYSYAPLAGTQAQWDACPGGACAKFRTCTITVYRDGVLVWGTPP